MQVGPCGACQALTIGRPTMARASARVTSLHGLTGLAPVALNSSFGPFSVRRARDGFALVVTGSCARGAAFAACGEEAFGLRCTISLLRITASAGSPPPRACVEEDEDEPPHAESDTARATETSEAGTARRVDNMDSLTVQLLGAKITSTK